MESFIQLINKEIEPLNQSYTGLTEKLDLDLLKNQILRYLKFNLEPSVEIISCTR